MSLLQLEHLKDTYRLLRERSGCPPDVAAGLTVGLYVVDGSRAAGEGYCLGLLHGVEFLRLHPDLATAWAAAQHRGASRFYDTPLEGIEVEFQEVLDCMKALLELEFDQGADHTGSGEPKVSVPVRLLSTLAGVFTLATALSVALEGPVIVAQDDASKSPIGRFLPMSQWSDRARLNWQEAWDELHRYIEEAAR